MIDDEEERRLKAEESGEEVDPDLETKRRMLKCKKNLQNNTRNLIRYLLKNEHDMAIVKQLSTQ